MTNEEWLEKFKDWVEESDWQAAHDVMIVPINDPDFKGDSICGPDDVIDEFVYDAFVDDELPNDLYQLFEDHLLMLDDLWVRWPDDDSDLDEQIAEWEHKAAQEGFDI